jgi:hypothetical protein
MDSTGGCVKYTEQKCIQNHPSKIRVRKIRGGVNYASKYGKISPSTTLQIIQAAHSTTRVQYYIWLQMDVQVGGGGAKVPYHHLWVGHKSLTDLNPISIVKSGSGLISNPHRVVRDLCPTLYTGAALGVRGS